MARARTKLIQWKLQLCTWGSLKAQQRGVSLRNLRKIYKSAQTQISPSTHSGFNGGAPTANEAEKTGEKIRKF
jgi:hypothetical protein